MEKKLPGKAGAAKPAAALKKTGAPPVKAAAQKKAAAVKKSAIREKAPAAAAEKKPARAPRGGIPFVCSECYEEFILPATYSRETVSCPECMHVGKRPAEDFLRTVTMHKSGERGSLKLAFSLTYMMILSAIILIWLATPFSASTISGELRGTLTLALGGLALVLLALLVWAASRYEKNRWEIYF